MRVHCVSRVDWPPNFFLFRPMARRSKNPLRRQLQHRHSRAAAQKRRLIRIMKPVPYTHWVAKKPTTCTPDGCRESTAGVGRSALCERTKGTIGEHAGMQEESIILRRRFFLSFFLQFYSLLVRTTGHDGSNKFCGILNGLKFCISHGKLLNSPKSSSKGRSYRNLSC